MATLTFQHDPDCQNCDIIERDGSMSCIGCANAARRREEAEVAADGWQPAPLPPGVPGGLLLVEFGLDSCGPEDRDRYAFASAGAADHSWTFGEIEPTHEVRWMWLRRG